MTTIEKITNYLHQTTPTPQSAAQIAEGTNTSVSTVRKNLKKMREENKVIGTKIGNATNYTLPQTEQQPEVKVEEPAVPSFAQPESSVEETPIVTVETPEEPTIKVNSTHEATPRDLIAKLRQRQEKHRLGMNDASLTPCQRKQHRRQYKRRTRRLEALEAQHA